MTCAVSIIIPTLNGGRLFEASLESMRSQSFDGEVQIVVVDSESTDNTSEIARRFDAELSLIPAKSFHHARTRNRALRLARHDLLIFTVQDAIPYDRHWLQRCVRALDDPRLSAACGRQIPRKDADLYSRFVTEFHGEYLGSSPVLYSMPGNRRESTDADYAAMLKSVRFDNVCAVYRRNVLEAIPFPEVPYGEDLAWSRAAQRAGHTLLYDPGIRVYHSHDRPAEYHFRRTIVDVVNCGRILKSCPADRSRLELHDLLPIRSDLESETRNFLEGAGGTRGAATGVREEVVDWFRRMAADVRRRYPAAGPKELGNCLPKLAALVFAQIVAQAFLSHEMNGTLPEDLAEYVASQMNGV